MVSFEIFVKAMPPSLSELKVLPSFCFAFKIPDDVAASNIYRSRIFSTCNHYYYVHKYVFKAWLDKLDQWTMNSTKKSNVYLTLIY